MGLRSQVCELTHPSSIICEKYELVKPLNSLLLTTRCNRSKIVINHSISNVVGGLAAVF